MGSSSSADKGAGAGAAPKKAAAATPAQPQLSDSDKAVLDIKRQQGRLLKTRLRLENDASSLVTAATRLKQAGQPERALTLLKLRRSKLQVRVSRVSLSVCVSRLPSLVFVFVRVPFSH